MKVIASLCLATITGCVAPPEPSRDSRHDWSAKPTGACSADVEDDRLYASPGAKVTLQTMGRKDYYFDGDDEHGQVIVGIYRAPDRTKVFQDLAPVHALLRSWGVRKFLEAGQVKVFP